MIKVRYTPQGSGTFDGMQAGDEREVSERYYQAFEAFFTPVDEIPSAEESERDYEPKEVKIGATEAIKMIGQIDDAGDLSPFLKDDRKSVRQRAEARKRVLDASADGE